MTEDVEIKHTAKDSIFTDLFSIPKYLLELFQALHPEDKTTTVNDLKSITCRCILAEHPYNDLGFRVGNRLIVLVEAQSSWSPNIVLRLLSYWVQTLNNYFTERHVLLYKNKKVACPKPELYVIYTGARKNKPNTLSFRELYFPDDPECDIDVRVHMLYHRDKGDIIDQYITFCKVLTGQVKRHGKTQKAIFETLRICKDKKILEDYLKQREAEIMDIMTTLFDQNYITSLYGEDQRKEGRKEGMKKGLKKGLKRGSEKTAIRLLKLNVAKDIIMKATGLSESELEKLKTDGCND